MAFASVTLHQKVCNHQYVSNIFSNIVCLRVLLCLYHSAQVGGPIALVKNGDPIRIDARPDKRTIDLVISDEEWAKRRKEWVPPPLRVTQGTLFKYIQSVATASEGCVTDETVNTNNVIVDSPKTPAVAELELQLAHLKEQLAAALKQKV